MILYLSLDINISISYTHILLNWWRISGTINEVYAVSLVNDFHSMEFIFPCSDKQGKIQFLPPNTEFTVTVIRKSLDNGGVVKFIYGWQNIRTKKLRMSVSVNDDMRSYSSFYIG